MSIFNYKINLRYLNMDYLNNKNLVSWQMGGIGDILFVLCYLIYMNYFLFKYNLNHYNIIFNNTLK